MVRSLSVPSKCISLVHRADSNCRPLSVVTVDGTPNRETHPCTKACATVSAVMSDVGMASGQRVNRSIQVRAFFFFWNHFRLRLSAGSGVKGQCGQR